MQAEDAGAGRLTFHTDRRGVWRVTWTLAWGFLLVAWLMRGDGAALWPLFAGVALLLVGLGVSALLAPGAPLVGVWPEGLRVYAGRRGLAGRGDAGGFTLPWSAIERVGFEPRQAAAQRGEIHPRTAVALRFQLRESAPQPDGQRGFLEPVTGRGSERALGEHFAWTPAERKLDLLGHPRGGLRGLTAAIARAEPRLGDASSSRRPSLGGPLAYAVYDAGLALVVAGTLLLWALGRMDVYAALGRLLLAWGGRVLS